MDKNYAMKDNEKNLNIYVRYKNVRDVCKYSNDILQTLNISTDELENSKNKCEFNQKLLTIYGIIDVEIKTENHMPKCIARINYSYAIELMIIIIFAAISILFIIILYNAFLITINERKKEYAVLNSIGGTEGQILKMILFEGIIMGAIGIFIGGIISIFSSNVILKLLNNILKNTGYNFRFILNIRYIILSLGIIIFNIFIINIIVFIILKYINIQYEELLRKELAFKGFEQQRTDIEAINYKYNWLKKKNHEVKHVMQLMEYYIENNQYEKIKQIINIKDLEKNIRDDEAVYVGNPIINYILNRNINICNKNNIDIKCNVMGTVDGIADIDLYILISNLIDNSVEAVKKIKEALISILIYSNERYIYIEIGNSTDNNVMKNNPKMKTTKDNKLLHGYGIENIRDIINKYHGEIEYKNQTDTYIVCKVILLKNIETQEN